jgi:hypothetical protein
MPIISQNQSVKAHVALIADHLDIEFADDPSFIRGETVVIDLMQRSIGIIFQSGYHHIGDLPKGIKTEDMKDMTNARLMGHGAKGRIIELRAPVKIIRQ